MPPPSSLPTQFKVDGEYIPSLIELRGGWGSSDKGGRQHDGWFEEGCLGFSPIQHQQHQLWIPSTSWQTWGTDRLQLQWCNLSLTLCVYSFLDSFFKAPNGGGMHEINVASTSLFSICFIFRFNRQAGKMWVGLSFCGTPTHTNSILSIFVGHSWQRSSKK